MRTRPASFLLVLLALSVLSCRKDNAADPLILGRWQLASRQCECMPGPAPDVAVEFTSDKFFFYHNGQLVSEGTYLDTTAQVCGSAGPAPALRFRYTTPPGPQQVATVRQQGNSLILDYGSACDNYLDTYTR